LIVCVRGPSDSQVEERRRLHKLRFELNKGETNLLGAEDQAPSPSGHPLLLEDHALLKTDRPVVGGMDGPGKDAGNDGVGVRHEHHFDPGDLWWAQRVALEAGALNECP
jgi:hypothetical protein